LDNDDDYVPKTSFMSESQGQDIFRAVWEYVSAYDATPDVHDDKWKMKLDVDFEGNLVSEDDSKVALKFKVAMRELARDSDGNPEKFRIEF